MDKNSRVPESRVLLLQGGGALGAYQAGVFEAMDRAGLQPDWVVGTSIGAINAAIIAGNPPQRRLEHLFEFWSRVGQDWTKTRLDSPTLDPVAAAWMSQWNAIITMAFGVDGFFRPRWGSSFAFGLPVAPGEAAHYDVAPLARTLEALVDFDYLSRSAVRLSVGAVDVQRGQIRYFDSREEPIGVQHILASSALPPAFAPVEIDGRHYWDGGIYSNTPLERVLRDDPCKDILCFLATLWPVQDVLPESLRNVLRRRKEIQFASRADTVLELEQEIYQLRRDVALLAARLPASALDDEDIRKSVERGCRRVCHLVRLQAPRLPGEDDLKDIDFAPTRVNARWAAGCRDTASAIARQPWSAWPDHSQGLVLHEFSGAPVKAAEAVARPQRGAGGASRARARNV